GELLDGFGHLAQYAFARGTGSLRLKHAALARGYKRRHVRQPGRSVLAQNVEHIARGTAETGEAIKYRKVSFAGAEMLQTLAVGDEDSRQFGGLFKECLNQCGLADSGFSSDEDGLALAGENTLQHAVQSRQLSFAPQDSNV